MNKISLTILVVAAMLLTFAGCKKEGVYNPKKKISRIFYEYKYDWGNSNGKQPSETWTWNGNLLDRITDCDGDITMFEYDGKQLKCVRDPSGSRYEFTYDGKKVKECNYYTSNGKLDETYTFTHDGSKISKIKIIEYDNDKKSMKPRKEHSLISWMMPGTKLAENIDRQLLTKATKGKGNYTLTISFEWDGDNVSKATYEEYEEDAYASEIYQFTYDKKSNPYYNSLYDVIGDFAGLSKNNVTKETCTSTETTDSGTDTDYDEYTYSYTYDGKFPTEQKYGENGYYHITYYEYQ